MNALKSGETERRKYRSCTSRLEFFKALKQATQEAIAAGKGPDEINVPEFYEVPEEFSWLRVGTLQRFHAYYQNTPQ